MFGFIKESFFNSSHGYLEKYPFLTSDVLDTVSYENGKKIFNEAYNFGQKLQRIVDENKSFQPYFGADGIKTIEIKETDIYSQCYRVFKYNDQFKVSDSLIKKIYIKSIPHLFSFIECAKLIIFISDNQRFIGKPVLEPLVIPEKNLSWNNAYDALIYVSGIKKYVDPNIRWEVLEKTLKMKDEFYQKSQEENKKKKQLEDILDSTYSSLTSARHVLSSVFDVSSKVDDIIFWGEDEKYADYLTDGDKSIYNQFYAITGGRHIFPYSGKKIDSILYDYIFDKTAIYTSVYLESFDLFKEMAELLDDGVIYNTPVISDIDKFDSIYNAFQYIFDESNYKSGESKKKVLLDILAIYTKFLEDKVEEERREKESIELEVKRERDLVRKEALKYIEVFLRKYKTLCGYDEYDILDKTKFIKEVEYFSKNKLPFIGLVDAVSIILEVVEEYFQKESSTIDKKFNLESMTPIEYEHYCSDILIGNGWDTRVTSGSGDQGVDVIAIKNSKKVVIQCKLYSNPVGNKAVQEVLAAKIYEGADYAVVVTNSSYTPSAKKLANVSEVLLLHHEELEILDEKLSI